MSTIDVDITLDITELRGENQSMAGVRELGRVLCILNSHQITNLLRYSIVFAKCHFLANYVEKVFIKIF